MGLIGQYFRSTNTILGIANSGNLSQIYNTNIQENLDYIPSSAESVRGLRNVTPLCFGFVVILMISCRIY